MEELTNEMTQREARFERDLQRKLEEIGDFESVKRFLRAYGNIRTRVGYVTALSLWLRWLKTRGVNLNPDSLVEDNLERVYGSRATDVKTKRFYMDLLSEYVNEFMTSPGYVPVESGKVKADSRGYVPKIGARSDSLRKITAAAVMMFFRRNDSELFGDFQVAVGKPERPPAPLVADEVRLVLKSLPLTQRLPLLMVWQSSCEIGRILGLRWKDLDLAQLPARLELFGRKRHRKAYSTYFGRESVEGLHALKKQWTVLAHRDPTPDDLIFVGKGGKPADEAWINSTFRDQAIDLHAEGLIKNGDPRAWHSHALRGSFETEGAHAGAKKEVRGYFESHVGDIMYVYSHTDELHPEDMAKEYAKIEPLVSLNPSEIVVAEKFEGREKALTQKLEEFAKMYEEMKRELESRGVLSPTLRPTL
ncbi:MAG TPA: hypothetical protein VGR56_07145 [Nitrososphaerales archaeon]|nr:hypothetical protein [Nitrososphaerales archaeon]